MSQSDEANLIRGLKEGREDAQRQLWDRHHDDLYRHVVGGHARNEADADEIVADAFFRAFRDIGAFRGDCKLRTWLFTLARNAAKDYYRLAANKHPPPGTIGDPTAVHDVAASADAGGVNPLAMVLSKERRDQLHRIIAQLSEDHRSVVTLRIIDGLSVKETAKIMGKTEGAVKMLLMRGLKTLGPAIKAAPYFADSEHEEEVAGYEGE